jgi:hypothetical protein
MPGKIFISYRRDDSAGHAGRVHDRLVTEFGRDVLFMDVDAVPLGSNFVKVLGEEVGKCDMLLAVIGPHWLEIKDEHGRRRLDDPADFVRVEIAAALERDIPVVPILLESTSVPRAEELPEELKELTLRNALYVRHASFHADIDKLLRFLRTTWRPREAERMTPSEDSLVGSGSVRSSTTDGWSQDIDLGWLIGVVAVVCIALGSLVFILLYLNSYSPSPLPR